MSRNAPKCILGIVVVAVFFGLTWSTTAARLTLTTTGTAVNPSAARASAPAKLFSSRRLALTASPTAASVTTDKSDYVPGETVHVTGTGWQAGETVRLDFDEEPSVCPRRTFTSVADGGNITNDELVLESHDRGLTITLTATGLSSNLTATTTFTDAPLVTDFKQGANNDSTGSDTCTPLPNCEHWIGSIVQASNAIYFEGMTNPQRVGLINMDSALSHTLTFRHDFTKGGIHAYDFLTGFYDAQNIVPAMPTGPFSPPLALNVCGPDIGPPAGTGALCNTLHTGVPAYGVPPAPGGCTVPNVFGATFVDLAIPDDGTSPIVDPIDGPLCARIRAYELATGCNRTIRIISNQIITGATLSYALVGSTSGDSSLAYTLNWTTSAASTQAIIEMGGHLAKSGDPGTLASCAGPAQLDDIAWGVGQGSSQISGGPYHFNLDLLDAGSLGNQDNQIKGADIQVVCPTCSVSGPTGPVCPGTSQEFTVQVGVCENQTIAWTLVNNTSGATFTSATNLPTVTVNSGTVCGSYTVRATVTCTGCTPTVCDAVVSVQDTELPTIGGQGPNSTIECPGVPSFTPPTASDNCGGATVHLLSDTTAAGTCANTFSRTQTWDATDVCGNHSTTVSQTVSVVDTTAPTIGSPGANATIQCPGVPSFTPPTASDTCSGATVNLLSDTTAAGTCANNFSRTRTWDATDACGNHSGTVSQTISVVDTTPPTIGSPGANATIQCPGVPSFTPPTASDTCGGATVNLLSDTTAAGTCANNFSRTRTWDATDACGNHSGTVSQTITVVDTTPPTIGAPGANATIQCPGVPSFTPPTASDACGGATVNLLSDTTAAGTCANNFSRTRTWDATDACGNHSGTVSQTISVVDTTPPTIGSPGANATIQCPGVPSFTPPTASDACGGSTVNLLSDTTAAGTCANNFSRTRTWDATDACGNHSGTVSQTISVVDTTPPTIGSPGANATIQCPGVPSFTPPTASDTCGGATVNLLSDTTAAGTCANNFSRTRTWDATDACGNHSGTVSQTITVVDTTPPTIGSPGANATITCPNTPQFTPPTASDTCGGATVQIVSTTPTGSVCAGTFSATRTWRAIDACGNTSGNVSQTIFVVPNPLSCSINTPGVQPLCFSMHNTLTANVTATGGTCVWSLNQAAIDAGWALEGPGDCTGVTYTAGSDVAPAVFTLTVTDSCGCQTTCTITVRCLPPEMEFCTLTQGAYGNSKGKFNGIRRDAMIKNLLDACGPIVLGIDGVRFIKFTNDPAVPNKNAANANCIISVMPAGGTPTCLPDGTMVTINGVCTFPANLLNNGRFNNVLIGQVLALTLNICLDQGHGGGNGNCGPHNHDLAGLNLCTLLVTRPASPGPNNCLGDDDDIATGSQSNFHIPMNVLCALQNLGLPLTVDGLLQLANRALACQSTDVATIPEINQAVDAINDGFDECRFLINHCDDRLDECPGPVGSLSNPNVPVLGLARPLFPFAPATGNLLSWLNWDRTPLLSWNRPAGRRVSMLVDAEANPGYFRLRL